MESEKSIQIHIFGGSEELFEKLFPKKGEIIQKKFGTIKTRFNKKDTLDKILFFKKQLDVEWIGYKYPQLSNDNYKKILFDFSKYMKNSKNKKIIILKFGNSYLKEFRILINKIDTDHPCVYI